MLIMTTPPTIIITLLFFRVKSEIVTKFYLSDRIFVYDKFVSLAQHLLDLQNYSR